jgi:hypothetical protein
MKYTGARESDLTAHGCHRPIPPIPQKPTRDMRMSADDVDSTSRASSLICSVVLGLRWGCHSLIDQLLQVSRQTHSTDDLLDLTLELANVLLE